MELHVNRAGLASIGEVECWPAVDERRLHHSHGSLTVPRLLARRHSQKPHQQTK
jgi:hypothetical protein